jgi:arylformamidase
LPVWPGDASIELAAVMRLSEGDEANVSRLACSVHSGTHIDAPAHFIEDGATVDQLPLDILRGRAVVVDIPQADKITARLLETLPLPPRTTRLLLKTRNSDLWADPAHRFHEKFVALCTDAAEWLVAEGFQLVGIDYLSIQRYKDAEPLTHRTLLSAGVVIVEGLDLRGVEPGDYELVCLPLKLAGCEGAPARAILIEP